MKSLFSEFNPVTSKQWKQQLQFELKGKDYNDTLVWHSPEDIKVKPFYHSDENTTKYTVETKSSDFKICQNIFVHDVAKSIYRANDTILRGATAIRFTIENPEIDIERLLTETNLNQIPVYINLSFLDIEFIKKIQKIGHLNNLEIYTNLDPISHLSQDGNWPQTPENNVFETLKTIANNGKFSVAINGSLFQNAGANITQELAYCMAQVVEYFENIGAIECPIVFEMAIGTNYFFEIAKFKTLRILFKTIASQYEYHLDCKIIATPSHRNKTIYDYNTNMIRTTTECMSAILGGVDAIANLPYDTLYHKDNEFADRVARNQLLILQKEAYFDKIDNPTDGSFYIESLTAQLADKALILFKEIELSGGYLKQLYDGNIQKKIAENHQKEQELFDSGKITLLGTNKFPNLNDRMQHDLELYPFLKIKPRKTLVKPIIKQRLASNLEQERLKTES